MTHVTFLRDTETITASHVCRYSVNHSKDKLAQFFGDAVYIAKICP